MPHDTITQTKLEERPARTPPSTFLFLPIQLSNSKDQRIHAIPFSPPRPEPPKEPYTLNNKEPFSPRLYQPGGFRPDKIERTKRRSVPRGAAPPSDEHLIGEPSAECQHGSSRKRHMGRNPLRPLVKWFGLAPPQGKRSGITSRAQARWWRSGTPQVGRGRRARHTIGGLLANR